MLDRLEKMDSIMKAWRIACRELKDLDSSGYEPIGVEIKGYQGGSSLLIALTPIDGTNGNRPLSIPVREGDLIDGWFASISKAIEQVKEKSAIKPVVRRKEAAKRLTIKTLNSEDRNMIMKNMINQCIRQLGETKGLLGEYQSVQAHLPHLTEANAILLMLQASGVTDVRSFDEWKKVDASIKKGSKSFYIFQKNPDNSFNESVVSVFDVTQTTFVDEWQSPSAPAINHVEVLASLANFEIGHFKENCSGDGIVEKRGENILIDLNASGHHQVLLTAGIVAESLLEKKNKIPSKARQIVSSLVAQLYCLRHGFDDAVPAVQGNVETLLKPLSSQEKMNLLAAANRLFMDMTTRAEIVLEYISQERRDDAPEKGESHD